MPMLTGSNTYCRVVWKTHTKINTVNSGGKSTPSPRTTALRKGCAAIRWTSSGWGRMCHRFSGSMGF